jgi:hypothetical protein
MGMHQIDDCNARETHDSNVVPATDTHLIAYINGLRRHYKFG